MFEEKFIIINPTYNLEEKYSYSKNYYDITMGLNR